MTMANVSSLMGDEQFAVLKTQLETTKTVATEIALAKRAGLDVAAADAQNKANQDQILQIMQTYWPGKV